MLTGTTTAGMPTRRFSTAILTGAWPQTDPADCHAQATIQQRKALDLLDNAEDIRSTVARVVTAQSGSTIEAFHGTGHELASTITGHADAYFAMARTSTEVGHIVQSLRTDLDHIDARAHQQIDQIARSATARTAATAIADQGSAIGINRPAATPHPQSGSPTANLDDQIVDPGKAGPHIQMVDNKTGPQQPGVPAPPAPGAQPQIGPFPVPPEIAAAAPQATLQPYDPTGGLLMPQNLPPASPPPNIPGVTTAPQPAPPVAAAAPPSPNITKCPTRDLQADGGGFLVGVGMVGSGLKSVVQGVFGDESWTDLLSGGDITKGLGKIMGGAVMIDQAATNVVDCSQ